MPCMYYWSQYEHVYSYPTTTRLGRGGRGPTLRPRIEPGAELGNTAARPRAIERGGAKGSSSSAAITQICQRLDGIPLAIELAAARVKVLAVEQIAARLDDRFQLLTGGSQTVLPRHQTLRAMMDWSFELLSEAERILLRRLSVFAGGWTLEAAEAVCSGNGVDASDILDLMTQLVDKSLV